MNLKIKIIFLCLTAAVTIVASEQGASASRPSTPVTPHSPLKKLGSWLRLSPQATWQENLADAIVQDPRIQCRMTSDRDMEIIGNFLVNTCTWNVVKSVFGKNNNVIEIAYEHNFGDNHALVKENDAIKNWRFSIQINPLQGEDLCNVTIKNPDIKYLTTVSGLNPGETWHFKTSKQSLTEEITRIVKKLNPCSPGYGE